MSAFLTNPDKPNARPQIKGDMDYAIALENELVEKDIPYYYARLATIDMKSIWIPCFKKKLSPKQTANLLSADVKKSYNLT
jgi:hypothetical protein